MLIKAKDREAEEGGEVRGGRIARVVWLIDDNLDRGGL
jgi:hypothetical protein